MIRSKLRQHCRNVAWGGSQNMNWDPSGRPRPMGEPRRPESERRRFLGLELWQQIVAGLVVAAVIALIGHLIVSSRRPAPGNPSPGTGSSGQNSTPIQQSTSSAPNPGQGSITWLDQLTPASGEVSFSTAAPDSTALGSYQPLSHELMISSAQNGNVVTYNLDGRYKTLNIEVAVTGNYPVSSETEFFVGLNGTAYSLNPPSSYAAFFPLLTAPMNWIINVSGVQKLQLKLNDSTSAQGPPLLVSASLTS